MAKTASDRGWCTKSQSVRAGWMEMDTGSDEENQALIALCGTMRNCCAEWSVSFTKHHPLCRMTGTRLSMDDLSAFPVFCPS